jgi:hypothetical protein
MLEWLRWKRRRAHPSTAHYSGREPLSGRYRDFRLPRLWPKGRSSISVSAAAARWRLSSRMWRAFASETKHKATLLLDVLRHAHLIQPSAADGQPLGIVR